MGISNSAKYWYPTQVHCNVLWYKYWVHCNVPTICGEGKVAGSGCLGAGRRERPAYSSGWQRDGGGWTSGNGLRLGRSTDGDTEGLSDVDRTGNRELNSVWAGGIVTVLPVVTLLVVLVVV